MYNGADTDLARLACWTCRRQKRKCTRELPSCELCRKNRRQCQYQDELNVPAVYQGSESKTTTTAPGSSLYNHHPPDSDISTFFLDSYIFSTRRLSIEAPGLLQQGTLRDLTGFDSGNVLKYAEDYFQSSHRILPIVSKRRFMGQISTNQAPRADSLLLLLCMQVVSQSDGLKGYPTAKQCLHQLETQGIISVQLLQSALLLGLYEIGNAIYPAAFLSAGHCARLGQAMGLHDRRHALQMFPTPRSWTELEELRRTWWAVIILDRYVNIGLESRPFACGDASAEDLLPMDEASWEQGEQAVIPSLAVSASTDLAASPSARTCQASHLLSRVLAHIHINSDMSNRAAYYSQAHQLHDILSSFYSAISTEVASSGISDFACLSSALGICFSAMMALYDAHSCAEQDDLSGVGIPEQLSIQQISLDGLLKICASVSDFAVKLLQHLEDGVDDALFNPFVTECLYTAAKMYQWYIRETGKVEYLPSAETLKNALRALTPRLQVGHEYLKILDGDDLRPI